MIKTIIEELEKIKAEIEEIKGDSLEYNASDYLYGRYQAFDITLNILEERIAELKEEKTESEGKE